MAADLFSHRKKNYHGKKLGLLIFKILAGESSADRSCISGS